MHLMLVNSVPRPQDWTWAMVQGNDFPTGQREIVRRQNTDVAQSVKYWHGPKVRNTGIGWAQSAKYCRAGPKAGPKGPGGLGYWRCPKMHKDCEIVVSEN